VRWYVLRRERTSVQELRNAVTQIDSTRIQIDDQMKQSNPTALSLIEMADAVSFT